MLNSALEHYERQQRLTAAALVAVRRQSWRDARSIAEIVAAFQILAARESVAATPRMLAEQDLPDAPVARVNPSSVAGTASDGRGLASLFEQATSPEALALMVATQVQDAARTAGGLTVAVRPGTGYVRMLNAPSCSRCVILAGKFYKWNAGFLRHPRCDCRHVPSVEDVAGDLATNPEVYFQNLPQAERDRVFGRANAQAIADGADMGRIVNLYRPTKGMQEAGLSATTVVDGAKFSNQGRVLIYTRIDRNAPAGSRRRERVVAVGRATKLMPEAIYKIAGDDRAFALRLLREHGYLL